MRIPALLSIIIFSLTACKKETTSLPKTIGITSSAYSKFNPSTIPDNASFKIKLVKDSFISDQTFFVFNQNFSFDYVVNEDAPYFSGMGQVVLSSISSDGWNLAINSLPYHQDMSIRLYVNSIKEGTFYLQKSYSNNIPSNIHVWLKDTYLKDSVNIFKTNYKFKMKKTDTNSFGSKRFKLILKYTTK